MKKQLILSDTLERLNPEDIVSGDVTGQETLELHYKRYEFAAQHARPRRLLDVSCGVGYGTHFLVERRPELVAVGVDICKATVAYAQFKYKHDRISFVAADAHTFSDPDGFDSIVSLETMEHLTDPEKFLTNVLGQLRSGGVFIASVPVTPSVDANPHHLWDFTESQFRGMLRCHGLQEMATLRQVQPFKVLPILRRTEARTKGIRRNLPLFYLKKPKILMRRIYSIARDGFKNRYLTVAAKKTR